VNPPEERSPAGVIGRTSEIFMEVCGFYIRGPAVVAWFRQRRGAEA
jgi:hypothetical protein